MSHLSSSVSDCWVVVSGNSQIVSQFSSRAGCRLPMPQSQFGMAQCIKMSTFATRNLLCSHDICCSKASVDKFCHSMQCFHGHDTSFCYSLHTSLQAPQHHLGGTAFQATVESSVSGTSPE